MAHRAQLLDALAEAVPLLRAHNEDRWASWLETDAARISDGDDYGLDHLLQAFGGMGSLNDLALPGPDDDRLWSLRERMWSSARALQRERG